MMVVVVVLMRYFSCLDHRWTMKVMMMMLNETRWVSKVLVMMMIKCILFQDLRIVGVEDGLCS